MRVWHVTKTDRAMYKILGTKRIGLGRNVASDQLLAHISSEEFKAGNWALDVIGEDTNQAWILALEISDDTVLTPDPADDAGNLYGGGWLVSEVPIEILTVLSVQHIPNVQAWESKTNA